jgi:hypothetical protein
MTSMPRVGYEPTILAFEWVKTVHALDHTASDQQSNLRTTGKIKETLDPLYFEA